MKHQTFHTGIVVFTFLLSPGMLTYTARAEEPGRHPAYLRARSDLRAAQFLLRVHEEPALMSNLHVADEEVEAAVREIDRAALIDGKNPDEHPQVDRNFDRAGRLRRIGELLRDARADLAQEEDDGRARGWRNAAYEHIDRARARVNATITELRIDRGPSF